MLYQIILCCIVWPSLVLCFCLCTYESYELFNMVHHVSLIYNFTQFVGLSQIQISVAQVPQVPFLNLPHHCYQPQPPDSADGPPRCFAVQGKSITWNDRVVLHLRSILNEPACSIILQAQTLILLPEGESFVAATDSNCCICDLQQKSVTCCHIRIKQDQDRLT